MKNKDELLHSAVKKFIVCEPLHPVELGKLRAYVWSFVTLAEYKPEAEEIQTILSMNQEQLFRYISEVLTGYSIHPF